MLSPVVLLMLYVSKSCHVCTFCCMHHVLYLPSVAFIMLVSASRCSLRILFLPSVACVMLWTAICIGHHALFLLYRASCWYRPCVSCAMLVSAFGIMHHVCVCLLYRVSSFVTVFCILHHACIRQKCVQRYQDRSYRSNLVSHPVTVYLPRAGCTPVPAPTLECQAPCRAASTVPALMSLDSIFGSPALTPCTWPWKARTKTVTLRVAQATKNERQSGHDEVRATSVILYNSASPSHDTSWTVCMAQACFRHENAWLCQTPSWRGCFNSSVCQYTAIILTKK